jgi:hypothetical protein
MPDNIAKPNDTILPVAAIDHSEGATVKLRAASQGGMPDVRVGETQSESGVIPIVQLVDRHPRANGGWYETDSEGSGQKKIVAFSDGTETYHLAGDGNSWKDSAGESRLLQVTATPGGDDLQVNVRRVGLRPEQQTKDSGEGKSPFVTRTCASDATRDYTVDGQGNVIRFVDKSHVEWKRDFRGSATDWVDSSGKVKQFNVGLSSNRTDVTVFSPQGAKNRGEEYLRTESRPGGGTFTYNSGTQEVESFSGREGSWVLDRVTQKWHPAGRTASATDPGFALERRGNDIVFKGQGVNDAQWKEHLIALETARTPEQVSGATKASGAETVSGAAGSAAESARSSALNGSPDISALMPNGATVKDEALERPENPIAQALESAESIKAQHWIQEIRIILGDSHLHLGERARGSLALLREEIRKAGIEHDSQNPTRWEHIGRQLDLLDERRQTGKLPDSDSFVKELISLAPKLEY